MGSLYPSLDGYVSEFIARQHMFFVATAAESGLVNVSPRGGTGTLVVVDGHTLAYLDLTGSGVETIAHTRALNRITLMWCAFEGKPLIVRVHGTATVIENGAEGWDKWVGIFPEHPGARAVVVVTAERISDSCGMGVPLMAFEGDREDLDRWADAKGPDGIRDYWVRKNAESLDGLPGLRLESSTRNT